MRAEEQVIVVGGGPVGLVAALDLAQRGVSVLVLEAGAEINRAPRAMVYHFCVLEYLDNLGVLEDALAEGITTHGNAFRRYSTGDHVWLTNDVLAGHVKFPFNLNLGQDRLGTILLAHLSNRPEVEVRWNSVVSDVTQSDDGAIVLLEDGTSFTASYVIGADGARSRVRSSLGLEFEGMTWEDRFVATNIRYDFDSAGFSRANMVLDRELGCIVGIVEDGLWRVTFSESAGLPEEALPARIDAFMKRFLPEPQDYQLVSYSPYRMHQRAASSFRAGRVLLAGDAAHVTNPTGAMGLTSGLFDIEVLAEALAAVIDGAADESVLDRYAVERRRSFLDRTSPMASDFKRLVYDAPTEEAIDTAFSQWAAVVEDETAARGFLREIENFRTPSLLSS